MTSMNLDERTHNINDNWTKTNLQWCHVFAICSKINIRKKTGVRDLKHWTVTQTAK